VNGREPVEIMTSVGSPVYAEPGYLLYQRENRLLARPFDPVKLEFNGDPVMIGPAPRRPAAGGAPAVSVSDNGDLAFLNVGEVDTRLVWWDRKSDAEQALDIEPGHYEDPAISPDGRYVALTKIVSPEESDIWVLELDRMVMIRFTSGPGQHANPIWSPDGRYIAYSTDKDGPYNIFKKPFPGGGDPEPVAVNEMLFKNPCAWSPDGKYLLYEQIGTGTNMDLWIAPMDGSGEPRPYIASVYQEIQGDFSPDGKWVVYIGSDTGEGEMYVTSFPEPGRKYRLTTRQGFLPKWSAGGDEIFAVVPGGREMISTPVRMEPEFHAGEAVSLWRYQEFGIDLDVDPLGRGVLQVRPVLSEQSVTAAVVLNWSATLKDSP
jgi:dipeptidyl aminopeptidase/acylaminoacyl peptidase